MLIKFLQFCNKIFHSGPSTPHPQHKQNLAKLRTHTLSKGPLLPWTHTLARHKLISLSVFWSRGLHVNFERRASSSVPDFKGISQSTMSIRKTVRGCRPSTSSGPPEPHKASTSTAAGVAPSADVLAVLLGGYLGERISGPFSPGRCWWCWHGYDEEEARSFWLEGEGVCQFKTSCRLSFCIGVFVWCAFTTKHNDCTLFELKIRAESVSRRIRSERKLCQTTKN